MSNYVFSKDSLKKKFRVSEFLAEKLITSVAFLSIAIIILIFIFVFRETLPIFKSQKPKQNTSKVSSIRKDNTDRPVQYGAAETTTTSDRPEQYGGGEANTAQDRPEQYGATTGGDSSKAAAQTSMTSESEDANSGGDEGVVTFWGLLGRIWQPVSDNPRYGLLPLLIGTLKITIIAMFFAAPIGILAALYSVAFSRKWMKEIIKPVIEILAGFPSVVIGFFALMVMATFFQNMFGYAVRLNAFVGGVA